jgi:hypothetical protein
VIETPSVGNPGPAPPPVISVGAVGLPVYLDRQQMVIRPAADPIETREFDQRGDPLRDGTTRVVRRALGELSQDIARDLRATAMVLP